jgi:hypothetical protein
VKGVLAELRCSVSATPHASGVRGTLTVNLSNPSANAYIGDGQGVGTILNDD